METPAVSAAAANPCRNEEIALLSLSEVEDTICNRQLACRQEENCSLVELPDRIRRILENVL